MTPARPTDLITPDQRHVSKMLGFALALTAHEGLKAYRALSAVLRQRLTPSERQGLAWAALKACDPAEAQGIAEDLFEPDEPVGMPDAFYASEPADDAVEWAANASREELLAYGLAILDRLSPQERATLTAAVERQAAA